MKNWGHAIVAILLSPYSKHFWQTKHIPFVFNCLLGEPYTAILFCLIDSIHTSRISVLNKYCLCVWTIKILSIWIKIINKFSVPISQFFSQSKIHFFFLGCSGGSKAAKIASSNTFFKPFCVNAEHSTYFTALSSLDNFSAPSTVMGFCLFLDNFSIVPASSRKSTCVPTRRKGVFGQWWVISGTH